MKNYFFNQFFKLSFFSIFYLWLGCATQVIKVDAKIVLKDSWQSYETKTLENLKNFSSSESQEPQGKFGGILSIKEKATGFFHTAQIGDRWWMIDPEGYALVHIGMNALSPYEGKATQLALKKKYGTAENWSIQQAARLKELGFNAAGAWSDTELITRPQVKMAYTLIWDFMSEFGKRKGLVHEEPGHTGYPNDLIFVFDPEFEKFCDQHAQALLQTKDDPYLIGHFTDNEMPFPPDALDRFLKLDQNDVGFKAAQTWLSQRGHSAEVQIVQEERDAFVEFMASRYFEITSRAIRKYDGNHLILGARFHRSWELKNPFVIRAAGPFVDVISINYYRVWTPNAEVMHNWTSWAKKPFLITEWYAKGEDSGLANTTGAGWLVKTQKARGYFYQNFTLALLQSKGCIGWDWFKYMDNDPNKEGHIEPSNKDSNKGLVSITFDEYQDLSMEMRQLNKNVYELVRFFDSNGLSR